MSSDEIEEKMKGKLEEMFLKPLREMIPHDVLDLLYNKPLMKTEKQMRIERHTYSPICDIAVGPFSFEDEKHNKLYIRLLEIPEINTFVNSVKSKSVVFAEDMNPLGYNNNPRCLMSIEIERETANDLKHVLGSIANSSLMGKIGIVVISNDHMERVKRLLRYISHVANVEKVEHKWFRNVFVIHESTIRNILQLGS